MFSRKKKVLSFLFPTVANMTDCLDIDFMLGEQDTSGLQVLGRDACKNYGVNPIAYRAN